VDKSSFISSSNSFRRVPAAALLAVALFVAAESAVALLWRPDVVGPGRYGAHSPSYDYGYASDVPRLFRAGADWRYYPTEYVNIRPFSIRRARRDNEIRIFVLGASVSRGSGLQAGADYPSQLERALDVQLPEYDWEVINLSADGFGSTRMVNILTHMLPYGPDALIVHPHGTNEYEDARDARYRDALRTGINGLLLRSRLIVLLKKAELARLRTGNQLAIDIEDEDHAGLHPENISRWQAVLAQNIDRIVCMSRELEIPAVFIGRAERDAPGFRNASVERLNAPIRGEPHYVEAAAALARAAAEHPELDLWRDNTHYSEAGHAVLAQELVALFRSNRAMFDRIAARRAKAAPPPAEAIAARCGTLQLPW
jgi:hypothetical protein